jgi:hypothetical protein
MRRRILIVMLALGTIAGFTSGFRSLAYYRNGGGGCRNWNDRHTSHQSRYEADRLAAEDRLAEKVAERVERALAAQARLAPAQAPQQQAPVQMAPVIVVPPVQMVAPQMVMAPMAYPVQQVAYPAAPPAVAPAATAPQTAQALPPTGR